MEEEEEELDKELDGATGVELQVKTVTVLAGSVIVATLVYPEPVGPASVKVLFDPGPYTVLVASSTVVRETMLVREA